MMFPTGLKKEWLAIAEKLATGPTTEELKIRSQEVAEAIGKEDLPRLRELGINARIDHVKGYVGLELTDAARGHLARLGPERGRLLLGGISIQACLLRQIPHPTARASIVHAILESNKNIYQNLYPENVITCRKGCSFCCHIKVSATEDEALLLLTKPLTKKQLTQAKRKRMGPDRFLDTEYIKLPLADRRCVYLDDRGECTTYYTRPSVCRNHHSIDPPEKCDTDSDNDGQVRYTSMMDSDILICAHWQISPPGNLATQLLNQMAGHRP